MFADVDNDGWPDLLLANGHVYPEVDQANLGATYREPRFLYWNLGNGKFKDVSKLSGPGLTEPLPGRGLALADLWNDGRLEAVVNNLSDRPMLLVNEARSSNHWVGLHLLGTHSNRSAIGARVTLTGEQMSLSEAGWMKCAVAPVTTAAATLRCTLAWAPSLRSPLSSFDGRMGNVRSFHPPPSMRWQPSRKERVSRRLSDAAN